MINQNEMVSPESGTVEMLEIININDKRIGKKKELKMCTHAASEYEDETDNLCRQDLLNCC